MGAAKIAITIQEDLLTQIDRWVREGRYPNRSRAIQAAVVEKLERARRRRLADELAKVDPRKCKVVELRYFGGLTVEETAEVLKVSAITIMRDWSMAKAWLYRALNREAGDET